MKFGDYVAVVSGAYTKRVGRINYIYDTKEVQVVFYQNGLATMAKPERLFVLHENNIFAKHDEVIIVIDESYVKAEFKNQKMSMHPAITKFFGMKCKVYHSYTAARKSVVVIPDGHNTQVEMPTSCVYKKPLETSKLKESRLNYVVDQLYDCVFNKSDKDIDKLLEEYKKLSGKDKPGFMK